MGKGEEEEEGREVPPEVPLPPDMHAHPVWASVGVWLEGKEGCFLCTHVRDWERRGFVGLFVGLNKASIIGVGDHRFTGV